MPGYVTHYLFAVQSAGLFDFATDDELCAYLWGAQGADLLFYQMHHTVAGLGRVMHYHGEERVLRQLQRLSLGDRVLRAYYYGFINHFVLDSTLHPYVYAVVPRLKIQGRMLAHPYLESDIDSQLYREITGKSIYTFDDGNIHLNRPVTAKIARCLCRCVYTVYGVRLSQRQLQSAFVKCHHVVRQLTKSGLLRKVGHAIDTCTGLYGMCCAHFRRENVVGDVLNHRHRQWTDGVKKYDYSAYQLLNIASDRYRQVLIPLRRGDFDAPAVKSLLLHGYESNVL